MPHATDARRVLVIGQQPALELALSALQTVAFEIESCDGSAEAVRRVRFRAIDLAITDPATPIREDLALALELEEQRPGLRVILLAPSVSPDDLVAALRAHVFACFTPPFDLDEIVAMVQTALCDVHWRDGIQVVSGLPNWITLKVACRVMAADRLVTFIKDFESALPDQERERLALAFREMLLNAMEYGGGFDPEQVVEVTAARTERTVVYHMRDPGPGFDRDELAHVVASTDPAHVIRAAMHRDRVGLRAGGFGILIARQIVDELVFNERGNEVLLVRHLC
jgi:anti-sigma regulatory factor (Ser/Thr protein kinase)/CheY-like chemotaxis protein